MVDAVATMALETLRDLLIEEVKFLSSVSSQVEEVRRQLSTMHSFLKDADRRQDRYNSQTVQNWVVELRDLSIQAENVLERYAIEVVSKREGKGLKKVLKRFTCILSEWLSKHQIGEEIKGIKSRMSDLTKQLESMSTGDTSSRSVDDTDWSRKTYGHEIEEHFVGMKEDIGKLESLLTKAYSKVLITTRNQNIASTEYIYKLKCLSEDEGWELLQKIALPTNCSQELPTTEIKLLEEYGREIVKKCGCLPLPISVLGGILRQEKKSIEWEKVCRNLDSYLQHGKGLENDKRVEQILDLSYNVLPYNLKPCFLYLACIREDEDIETKDLYLLWMAEGMISLEDRGRGESLRDVAERYLFELANSVSKLPPYEYTTLYRNVASLTLEKSKMEEDPMGILEMLPTLRQLRLESDAYVGREMVCKATGFPQLRYVFLSELSNLVEWKVEKGAMPNLSTLELYRCNKLEMLPNGLKFITALKTLVLNDMPGNFKSRARVGGKDYHKIRHVPSVQFF
ncbi:UNVERIFIED_CONTAM: putative disease resistance RPP8-like protein 2 [Sesamum radiatum]|uniref:Disease resistance RPP8-like protein 2 n=1 Tax=Sesamum radiatum TaxID=300843 RepID=A0AAW2UB13_SESRA